MTGSARSIRLFLLIEAVSFLLAALIHSGWLIPGYQHAKARIAEGIIGIVLFTGLGLTWIRPGTVRRIGMAAQGFALLGTLVGVFTIAVGVGPRTTPDIVYHIAIVVVLAWGLLLAAGYRSRSAD
jgi:hypothetical protein